VFLLQAVVIPYVVYVVLAANYAGRSRVPEGVSRVILALCVDVSILGVGITAGIFASKEVREKLGAESFAYGVLATLLAMLIANVCIRLRDWDRQEKGDNPQTAVSLFLALALTVANFLVAWKYI
jgi:hypothetical protein